MTTRARTDLGAPPAAPAPDRPSPASGVLPRWFALIATVPAVVFVTIGGTALVLAMAGRYTLAATLVIGLPLTAATCAVAVRALAPALPVARADRIGAAAAVVIALVAVTFTGLHPSQQMTIDRDPGSYSTTARWIARDGSLTVDAADGFRGLRGLQFGSAAVYDMGGGQLEFQFNHAASAAMAVAFDVGGQRLLFRLPAVAGAAALLPLYAVARMVTRRSWVAAAATLATAACLPFVVFSRGTYSEPFTMLVLWAGLLGLIGVVQRPSLARSMLAGGLLGATVMARVDGLAYLIPVVIVAAFLWTTTARREAAALLGAAAVTAAVGVVDGRYLTGLYYSDLSSQRRQLTVGLAVMAVGGVVAVALPAARRTLSAWLRRPGVAIAAGVLTTAALLAAWLVRPGVMTVRGDPNVVVRSLQEAQGLAVDPTRLYSEESLRWIGWYVGPLVLALAIAGAGLLVHRALVARRPPDVLLLLFVAFAGAVYLWQPSVTPEQIWAMRRFLPLVLPACFVLAGAIVGWIAGRPRLEGSGAPVRWAVAAAGCAALVVPPAMATLPVQDAVEQAGFLDAVETVCRQVPAGGGIVVAGPVAANTLPQSLRSWCGVPVAALTATATPADLDAAIDAWAEQCRALVLVTQNEVGAEPFLAGGLPAPVVAEVVNDELLERVIARRPSDYSQERLGLTAEVWRPAAACAG